MCLLLLQLLTTIGFGAFDLMLVRKLILTNALSKDRHLAIHTFIKPNLQTNLLLPYPEASAAIFLLRYWSKIVV